MTIEHLPTEVLQFHIFPRLGLPELMRFGQTNHLFQREIGDYVKIVYEKTKRDLPSISSSLTDLINEIELIEPGTPTDKLRLLDSKIRKDWESLSYWPELIRNRSFFRIQDFEQIQSLAKNEESRLQEDSLIKAWPKLRELFADFDVRPQLQSSNVEIREFLLEHQSHLASFTELDLSGLQLIRIPQEIGLFPNLQILNLNNNRLTKLADLSKLTHLQILTLSNNELTQLPNFRSQNELQVLNVENNKLQKIPSLRCTDLKQLLAASNEIEEFAPQDLPMLTTLGLNRNQIEEFKGHNLPSLNRLYLNYNQLKIISLEGCEALATLHLQNNLLEVLPAIELPNLVYLNVNNNFIRALPAFNGLMSSTIRLDPARFQFQNNPILFRCDQEIFPFASETLSELPLTIDFFRSQVKFDTEKGFSKLYSVLLDVAKDQPLDFFEAPVDSLISLDFYLLLRQEDRSLALEMGEGIAGIPLEKRGLFTSFNLLFASIHNAILAKYDRLDRNIATVVQNNIINSEPFLFQFESDPYCTSRSLLVKAHEKRNLHRLAASMPEVEK